MHHNNSSPLVSFETSATALCGTTGIHNIIIIYSNCFQHHDHHHHHHHHHHHQTIWRYPKSWGHPRHPGGLPDPRTVAIWELHKPLVIGISREDHEHRHHVWVELHYQNLGRQSINDGWISGSTNWMGTLIRHFLTICMGRYYSNQLNI